MHTITTVLILSLLLGGTVEQARAQPGSSICTYSPNYACYTNGWPSCCTTNPSSCPSTPPPCETDGAFQLVSDEASSKACAIVKDSQAKADKPLILGSCDKPKQAWKLNATSGMVRTILNETMCMQAGRGGTPQKGTKMRVFPCDKDNKLQQFDYNQLTVKLKNTTLCVAYRGVKANVNTDPLILKNCGSVGDSWSQGKPK